MHPVSGRADRTLDDGVAMKPPWEKEEQQIISRAPAPGSKVHMAVSTEMGLANYYGRKIAPLCKRNPGASRITWVLDEVTCNRCLDYAQREGHRRWPVLTPEGVMRHYRRAKLDEFRLQLDVGDEVRYQKRPTRTYFVVDTFVDPYFLRYVTQAKPGSRGWVMLRRSSCQPFPAFIGHLFPPDWELAK